MKDGRYGIFLDIDGTLLGASEDALKKNISVIQKVRALGHKVFICTGRSTAYLPKMIDYERSFDGVITGAGARIVLEGEVVFCSHVDYDSVMRFCNFSSDKPNISFLEGTKQMFFFGNDGKERENCTQLTLENVEKYVDDSIEIEKFAIFGIAASGLADVMGDDFVVLQHRGYAEVIQKNCSKSKAMFFVLERLGIPKENSVAMGDSMNDFDMVEKAGIGVAMENAVSELKTISDITTTSVDDAGVATALQKIFNL